MAEERKEKIESLDDSEDNTNTLANMNACGKGKIIILDVGGTKFKTTDSTLNKSGFFKGLLSGTFGDIQQDGSYFIDRNAEYFKYLLDYLRYDYVLIPSEIASILAMEAAYYQIDIDLTDIISKQKLSNLFMACLYDSKCDRININGEPLKFVYQKYGLDSTDWDEIKSKSWKKFLSHLIDSCGYEVRQQEFIRLNRTSNNDIMTWHLKPTIPKMTFIK